MSKQLLQETVGAIEAINASRDAERERVKNLIKRRVTLANGRCNSVLENELLTLLGEVVVGLYAQDLEE
jgi:hypothetical protein